MKAKTPVLAYDLGGTKVAVGLVSPTGKILEETRVPVMVESGQKAVVNQLADLGKEMLQGYSQVKKVGVASAGPLDPARGLLLDPTNLMSEGKSWGQVPIVRQLSQKLKRSVRLENDAAAAVLAEKWLGAAKGKKNAMILTLGTGLGTGVICNDRLVRAGRGLHTEAGHLILKADDRLAPCGCGNFGCAEAFLSAKNFGQRARKFFGEELSSPKKIVEMAKSGHQQALSAFEEYADMMAVAIHNYAVLFVPEIVVLTGSFASAAELFLPRTKERLTQHLVRRREGVDFFPEISVSKLDNQAGLLGGAYVALHENY